MDSTPEADTHKVKDEPSRWLSKWSHVIAILVFCVIYFPFEDNSWRWPVAVAVSYSVFAFAIALGLGLDNADDFFGDPKVPKYVATLLLPHSLILVLITSAASLWLHLKLSLPPLVTASRRLSLWDLLGVTVVWFAGTLEGIWMAAKIKRKFQQTG